MLNAIKNSMSAYAKNPVPFALVSLYYGALQILLMLAAAGLFMAMVFFISLFGLTDISTFEYAFAVIAGVAFLYLSAGAFGAYIRSISYVMNGEKPGFSAFFKYAVSKAKPFFGILVIKILVEAVFLIPPILLFVFAKKVPYINVIVALLVFGAMFVANFLFFFGYFSAALFDTRAMKSAKNSLGAIKRAHVFALAMFGIFIAVDFTLLIPLVNIITLFVTLPIMVASLVLFSQQYVRK